jgi:hypothetical protein
MNTTTFTSKHSMSRWYCPPVLTLVPLVLAWIALSPLARAVDPPPDGGYPNFNTAEGEDTLFSLTTGNNNTGIGLMRYLTIQAAPIILRPAPLLFLTTRPVLATR